MNKEMIKRINEELSELARMFEITKEHDSVGMARVYGMIDMLKIVDNKDYCILKMRLAYKEGNSYHDAYVNAD